ncbi:MAG: hypothetical protein FJ027_12670 [Candidatus Rokubacteria bacterium]|nr:hypothetical protein [Candidatus Rokubacteria bacterium]
MYSHTLALPLSHQRRRALFLARITQQVRSSGLVPELLRAGAALATIVAWGGALALLAG